MASYSDDFNRANGAVGADYDTVTGMSAPAVSSNTLKSAGVGQHGATVKTSVASFADDQEAYITIVTVADYDHVGVFVRFDPTTGDGYSASAANFYNGVWNPGRIVRWDSGTPTEIGSVNVSFSNGDKLKLKAVGTTISVEVDSGAGYVEQDSLTDSTHSSGQPGIYTDWGDSNSAVGDDFGADDLAAGTTVSSDQVTSVLRGAMRGVLRGAI